MRWWGWVGRRLRVLFRKDAEEIELDDEMRFHLDMQVREYVASGMSYADARRRAFIDFGGVERFKEEVRDVRGARVLDDWAGDTRIAIRSFLKEPAFLAAVLVTLGLGMGGTVAMLGVLESALLRSLPYPESDRLVMGRVTFDGEVGNTVSAPDYFDYREQSTTVASLSAYTPFELAATVTGTSDAERLRAPYASADLFRTLGVEPALGRDFSAAEGEPGAPSVVVLSHAFWLRRFSSDPDVLGRTLVLDGEPTTVIGVLPQSFRFPIEADVWRPLVRGGAYAGARQFHNWVLLGRLAPGVELPAAQAEIDEISGRLAELYPDTNRDKGLNFTPLRDALAERSRSTVLMLTSAMVLLLVIACANVGGVLLARGSARQSELAIRGALGAGRGRLLRQLLAESFVLVLASTFLGVGLARWIQGGVLGLVAVDVEPGLSTSTITVAFLAAAGTVSLFGALPIARGRATSGIAELRGRGRKERTEGVTRFRGVLVVAQVTLTVVLLTTSGLLVRSLTHLYDVDTGFDTDFLLTAEVHLPPAGYADVTRRPLFYEELERALESRPDVEAVGLVSSLPIRDPGNNVRVAPPAEWGQSGVFGRVAYQRMVLPGYFDALRIPLLAGRDVTMDDDRPSPNVIILSQTLAEDLFAGENPLGRELGVDVGSDEPWIAEVVGVVGDVTPASLAAGTDHTMYFSYGQRSPASMRLAVRTTADPAPVAAGIRDILREIDPDVPLAEVEWMNDVLTGSVSGRRAVMVLVGIFAAVALLLAAIGLYGVLAYQVARRSHEIGVRIALGSSVAGVVRDVVRSGFALVAIGLLLGLPGSWIAGRLISGLLFEVGPADPLTYLVAAGFLALVAGLACTLPAGRAAKVDPVVAFRAE